MRPDQVTHISVIFQNYSDASHSPLSTPPLPPIKGGLGVNVWVTSRTSRQVEQPI